MAEQLYEMCTEAEEEVQKEEEKTEAEKNGKSGEQR
jgi:hypothetical protein